MRAECKNNASYETFVNLLIVSVCAEGTLGRHSGEEKDASQSVNFIFIWWWLCGVII